MARFGRVALLGCTRNKEFTIDYYRKVHGPGITLIGAQTNARPEHESHGGWWTQRDDIETIIKLTSAGRIKLAEMVEAQDGCGNDVYDSSRLPQAPLQYAMKSERAGYISRIDAEGVGLVSMHLGGGRITKDSGIDLSVGVLLNKKLGDYVEAGETLAIIHAASEESAKQQEESLRACFNLSDSPVQRPAFIKAVLR